MPPRTPRLISAFTRCATAALLSCSLLLGGCVQSPHAPAEPTPPETAPASGPVVYDRQTTDEGEASPADAPAPSQDPEPDPRDADFAVDPARADWNSTPSDAKTVYLTFDDGPAATYTQQCLDILSQKGAKATFFNLAENEESYPELAATVASSDNQLCSHTNHHLDLATLSQADLVSEITTAHDAIQRISGVDTTTIRPPYGSFNQSCWLNSGGTICASILWNIDTVDWSLPGTDAIVENALAGVTSGSVILMHDGGGARDQGMEALPRIIDQLQQDGYTFVTISELLASDPEVPKDVVAGNATMPEGAVWPTEIGEPPIDLG